MQKVPFDDAVRAIRKKDGRFDFDAYVFLRDALDHTVKKLRSDESEEHRHVSGPELLNGMKEYALREFGPLAATVLENWGITRCGDVGDMVFQLIDVGAFGRSDEDRPEDFEDVFDFDLAFREPFRPQRITAVPVRSSHEPGLPPRGITPKSSSTSDEAPKQTLN